MWHEDSEATNASMSRRRYATVGPDPIVRPFELGPGRAEHDTGRLADRRAVRDGQDHPVGGSAAQPDR